MHIAGTLCISKNEKMIILEIISEFLIEVILIDIIGGTMSKLNNAILKLRGIETRTFDEIKNDKLKKRYEYKAVLTKSKYNEIQKGSKGVVLELINNEYAFVEFERDEDVIKVPLKVLRVTKQTR